VASQQPPSPAPPAAITHPAETQARRQSYRPLPNEASGGAVAASANGHIHDFVCEDDVKRAIAAQQKIYINSKTIITPAARDLGDQHDVFARPQ
jgi:hypothetical protein